MKKTKLLTPVLAVATLGSIAPIITLASCNKAGGGDTPVVEETIELDESTKKEQTTNPNVTVAYYEFNVKKTQTSNEDEEEEIEAEVEDVDTTDDVSVEISALKYDPSTGKCYVTVTISKEDGTLNDEEAVSFSLNFHCLERKSHKEKWQKKIDKFIIKHSTTQIWSGHFDDTDTTKHFLTNDKKESAEQTQDFIFPTADIWKEGTTEEGEYDTTKLQCYLLRDKDHHHFIDTIKLPSYDEPLTLSFTEYKEDEQQYLTVTVPYTITELAHYGDKARFSLMFTYEGEVVFQTIGGFSIHYVQDIEPTHVWLTKSREQHYYIENTAEDEKSKNFVSFMLDDKYDADKLNVTSSDERIQIGDKYVFEYTITEPEEKTLYFLAVNYTIKEDTLKRSDNVYNVTLTIESTEEETTWKQEIKGLSFFTIGKDWRVDTLIKADRSKLAAVEWKAAGKTNFNDVLRTCYPFNTTDFTYIHSYAIIDKGTAEEKEADSFTITQLGYTWKEKTYSKATLDTTTIATAAGKHTVNFYVYVITQNASYYYTLSTGEVEFK